MAEPEEIKLYFDYKSPFAYLAKEPAFALPERYAVALRWIPFLLRIKGKGERSSLLRVEGALLVHGRAPLGEPARRLPDHGAAQGLRLDAGADRRPLRRARGLLPPLHRPRLRALLRARARDRPARRRSRRVDRRARRAPAPPTATTSPARARAPSRRARTRRTPTTSSACRSSSSAASRSGATTACRCSRSG